MLEEKTHDLMVNMQALLPCISVTPGQFSRGASIVTSRRILSPGSAAASLKRQFGDSG
jgi:hypothetical protein